MRITVLVLFLAIFSFVFFLQTANACSITVPPLRKEFRDSTDVFIGEVVEISDAPQNYKDKKERFIGGIVKFKIEKRWKGVKASEVSLLSDIIDTTCGGGVGGNLIDYFRKGEKYLIFAEKDYVHFYKSSKLEDSESEIRRLNDFGFRLWTRIYPF
jgi:hypothetical protein